MYNYFTPKNMIFTIVSPRCDLKAQKILTYHFDTPKDGQVKVVMEASSEQYQQEILQKLKDQIDFSSAKAVNLPHPNAAEISVYEKFPTLTIELTIPCSKVNALVGTIRELEQPLCQLKEAQLAAVAYKYPPAVENARPSPGK